MVVESSPGLGMSVAQFIAPGIYNFTQPLHLNLSYYVCSYAHIAVNCKILSRFLWSFVCPKTWVQSTQRTNKEKNLGQWKTRTLRTADRIWIREIQIESEKEREIERERERERGERERERERESEQDKIGYRDGRVTWKISWLQSAF